MTSRAIADPGVIRALGLFLPLLFAAVLWATREPEPRLKAAALLGEIVFDDLKERGLVPKDFKIGAK